MYNAPFSYTAPRREQISHVQSYHVATPQMQQQFYTSTHSQQEHQQLYQPSAHAEQKKPYQRDNYGQTQQPAQQTQQPIHPHSKPEIIRPFLRNDRPTARFINTSSEVIETVHSLYTKIMEKELTNVIIHICSDEEMQQAYPRWHPSILGFARNSNGFDMNHIFVKKDHLDSLLLTIGHEIGHIITPSLRNNLNEEAKAFAFEFAWLKKIIETDVEGLSKNLQMHLPAENGLHDKSFAFVVAQLRSGKNALELFFDIANGVTKVSDNLERFL